MSGTPSASSPMPGRVGELGLHRARAERGGGDAGAGQVGVQGVGEREHEGLGGRVGGLARQRLEGGRGGHVEHAAAAARAPSPARSARRARPRPPRSGATISTSRSRSSSWKRPPLPKPALFTSTSTVSRRAAPARRASLAARSSPRVGGQGLDAHPVVGAQLRGQLLEPLLAAGHQRDARGRGAASERGDLGPDARGGAGDQAGGVRRGGRQRHARDTNASRLPWAMSSEDPFGGLFGDPDELRGAWARWPSRCRAPRRSRGPTTPSSWPST